MSPEQRYFRLVDLRDIWKEFLREIRQVPQPFPYMVVSGGCSLNVNQLNVCV